MNVLTIGSQGTQKKGDEQRQARYDALHLNKHEDHGHVIAKDMWQMLLKLYINSTKNVGSSYIYSEGQQLNIFLHYFRFQNLLRLKTAHTLSLFIFVYAVPVMDLLKLLVQRALKIRFFIRTASVRPVLWIRIRLELFNQISSGSEINVPDLRVRMQIRIWQEI